MYCTKINQNKVWQVTTKKSSITNSCETKAYQTGITDDENEINIKTIRNY
ncbi:hypothetical protein HanPSC8_Chr02g0076581 [Helianthus annuus]|nr:hypothetical protein HanPSC8_Chr02g0076581 [Helianthus annuus]